MSATADKRVPVSGGKDVSFADRGVSTANNNLPPDFLLGHSDKLIPEPYPGSGVALRQTIIYRRLIVTVNYSFFIFHSSFRREAPHFARRLSAAKPHIFRAISTENTKPQVLSAAVRPPDEAFPEAARLTAAYNLQATRHKKANSADYRCPSVQRKSATTSNI